MSASPVILSQKALWMNADTGVHTAATLRRTLDPLTAPGVQDLNSFKVRQRVAGAAMSVDVTDAATLSQAFVRGSSTNLQGMYYVTNSAPTLGTIDALYNVDIAAADPANPRIDQVYLCVEDAQHAGANNQATIRVVTGTATGGATLDNRTGVGAAPASMSSILLADILVGAAVATILTAAIRDRRPVGNIGTVPWLGSTGTQVDMVGFEPHFSLPAANYTDPGGVAAITVANNDNHQSCALMWLPRRIVSATKIRFRYQQGGTANAGNYALFIADASGRVVAQTAATAFAGAAGIQTEASIALTATTTFEVGWYYVGICVGAMTAVSTVSYTGVPLRILAAGTTSYASPAARNLALRVVVGGTTVPTTILGFTDVVSITAAVIAEIPRVPLVTLSVT